MHAPLSKWRHRLLLRRPYALCGAFDSFEEAADVIPHGAPLGYDHAVVAKGYQELHEANIASAKPIPSCEYPVLFWLAKIATERRPIDVFDFGGNLGIHWHRFHRFLDPGAIERWCVIEVPAIVAAGTELTAKLGTSQPLFYTVAPPPERPTVLLSSASIQYVDLSVTLDLIHRVKPKHIIMNRTPVSDS